MFTTGNNRLGASGSVGGRENVEFVSWFRPWFQSRYTQSALITDNQRFYKAQVFPCALQFQTAHFFLEKLGDKYEQSGNTSIGSHCRAAAE